MYMVGLVYADHDEICHGRVHHSLARTYMPNLAQIGDGVVGIVAPKDEN